MKKYIKPNTEIIAAISCAILEGSPQQNQTNNTKGASYEFSNTGDFEDEFPFTGTNLWDED